MLKPIVISIAFAILTAILPSSANAKSSNGGVGKEKDSSARIQARWPALGLVNTIQS
jgi:hypothetical protein